MDQSINIIDNWAIIEIINKNFDLSIIVIQEKSQDVSGPFFMIISFKKIIDKLISIGSIDNETFFYRYNR